MSIKIRKGWMIEKQRHILSMTVTSFVRRLRGDGRSKTSMMQLKLQQKTLALMFPPTSSRCRSMAASLGVMTTFCKTQKSGFSPAAVTFVWISCFIVALNISCHLSKINPWSKTASQQHNSNDCIFLMHTKHNKLVKQKGKHDEVRWSVIPGREKSGEQDC